MKRGMKAALVVICALVWLPTSALAAPPANDDFADREVLTGALPIEVTRSNLEATREDGEWIPGLSPAGHSIWFEWEAPGTEYVTVDSCGSDFPTILAVLTGTELENLTPRVAGNADEGPACRGRQQQYTFKATAGVKYVIAVDGNNYTGPEPMPVDTEGNVVLRIEPTPAPANDDFADATAIVGKTSEEPGGNRFYFATAEGYNWNATTEAGEPKDEDLSGASVWYAWTAPESGDYRIGQPCCGTGLSRSVYVGSSLGSLSPLLGPGSSEVTLSAGTALWIRVGGIPGADSKEPKAGSFHLNITAILTPTPAKPQLPVVPPSPVPPAPVTPETKVTQRTLEHRVGLARFRFQSTVPGSSFQCKLDKGRFRPCASPKTYRNLKPGRHVFRVKAIAPSGLVDPSPTVGRFAIAAPQRPQHRR